MVDVAKLIEAIGRLAWRHGVVAGPGGVRHDVHEDGSHVITISIPASIAAWKAPPQGNPKARYPSAGWAPPKK